MSTHDDFDLSKLLEDLDGPSRVVVSQIVRRLRDLQTDSGPARQPAKNELQHLVPAWANHLNYEGKSQETIKVYELYISELLREISDPRPIDIDMYLAAKAGEHICAAAIAGRISAYRSFFRYLSQLGVIASDPTAYLRTPRIPYRHRNIPTVATLRRIFNSERATARDRAQLMLLAGCGLRVAELVICR